MTSYNPFLEGREVPITELKLADTVVLFVGEYGTATVKQIKDGEVTFFRPYVATSDFSYTGGVICTIGIEETKYLLSSTEKFKVLSRKELK